MLRTADEVVAAERSSGRRRPRHGVGWPTETGSERPSGRLIDPNFSAPVRNSLRVSEAKQAIFEESRRFVQRNNDPKPGHNFATEPQCFCRNQQLLAPVAE
jgi:hypothetical protein